MNRPAARSWSVAKSLALLAALFAVVLAAALPSAVAASAAAGHPVQLCDGDQIFVVYDGADRPAPQDTDPSDSLDCADCLAGAFASLLPPPPPQASAPRIAPPIDRPRPVLAHLTPGAAITLRPPSTAPPTA
ncbi:MAG: hypothetical protein ACK4JY_06705 [Brevundimonas sp.]|uniref:hypothetical protein n=1 Tax=Brevundimonas sp. TaxID=1871086 RepID=UPI00391C980C